MIFEGLAQDWPSPSKRLIFQQTCLPAGKKIHAVPEKII
jgi:hypothetical protein